MTIPYQQQAYGSSTGTSPIPSYYFRDHDPTSSNTAPVYQLYSVWVNTVTKGIWYLESFTSSAGVVSSVWRAVAPIVVSSTGPASPLTSSSDYSYPIGQTWVDSTANDYYVMVSNPTDTTGYWIKLSAGTQGVDLFAMQTGTTPVGPDGSGIVTFSGATVGAGTNPVRTDGTGANTMTLEVQLSQAIAATDATKVGLSNFNSAHFSCDANGFVSLIGGGLAIDQINVDASTPPGSDPVLPSSTGEITITGAQVATGTIGANVIRTDSLAANTFTIEIQQSTAVASQDTTKNGVAHFDSNTFSCTNGFVSVVASGTFTPTLAFGGSSTGITYSTQAGYYQRIGNTVYFNIDIELTSKGAQTGAATITNMPIAANANGNHFAGSFSAFTLSLTASYTIPVWNMTPSTTVMNLNQSGSGQAYANMDDTNFTNTSLFSLQGFYFV